MEGNKNASLNFSGYNKSIFYGQHLMEGKFQTAPGEGAKIGRGHLFGRSSKTNGERLRQKHPSKLLVGLGIPHLKAYKRPQKNNEVCYFTLQDHKHWTLPTNSYRTAACVGTQEPARLISTRSSRRPGVTCGP